MGDDAEGARQIRFDVVQQLELARPGLTVHADLKSTCAAANQLV
jgi:hypothetical protein